MNIAEGKKNASKKRGKDARENQTEN